MGVTNPEAPPTQRYLMILVPMGTPGVVIERDLSLFGFHERGGHGQVSFTDVRVPVSNVIASEGAGYMIAQARLGPGRIHNCMRVIGMAERAFDLMVTRARDASPSAERFRSRVSSRIGSQNHGGG
jgi:acyl-CoA dehydrogenase